MDKNPIHIKESHKGKFTECAKAIIQTGISMVIMDTLPIDRWTESGLMSLDMFHEADVGFKFVNKKE